MKFNLLKHELCGFQNISCLSIAPYACNTLPLSERQFQDSGSEDHMILVLKKLLLCSNYFIICTEVIPREVFLHIGEEGVS